MIENAMLQNITKQSLQPLTRSITHYQFFSSSVFSFTSIENSLSLFVADAIKNLCIVLPIYEYYYSFDEIFISECHLK